MRRFSTKQTKAATSANTPNSLDLVNLSDADRAVELMKLYDEHDKTDSELVSLGAKVTHGTSQQRLSISSLKSCIYPQVDPHQQKIQDAERRLQDINSKISVFSADDLEFQEKVQQIREALRNDEFLQFVNTVDVSVLPKVIKEYIDSYRKGVIKYYLGAPEDKNELYKENIETQAMILGMLAIELTAQSTRDGSISEDLISAVNQKKELADKKMEAFDKACKIVDDNISMLYCLHQGSSLMIKPADLNNIKDILELCAIIKKYPDLVIAKIEPGQDEGSLDAIILDLTFVNTKINKIESIYLTCVDANYGDLLANGKDDEFDPYTLNIKAITEMVTNKKDPYETKIFVGGAPGILHDWSDQYAIKRIHHEESTQGLRLKALSNIYKKEYGAKIKEINVLWQDCKQSLRDLLLEHKEPSENAMVGEKLQKLIECLDKDFDPVNIKELVDYLKNMHTKIASGQISAPTGQENRPLSRHF